MMSKEVLAVVAAIILPTIYEDLFCRVDERPPDLDPGTDLDEAIDEAVAYAHDICQEVEESLEPQRDRRADDARPQHRRKR